MDTKIVAAAFMQSASVPIIYPPAENRTAFYKTLFKTMPEGKSFLVDRNQQNIISVVASLHINSTVQIRTSHVVLQDKKHYCLVTRLVKPIVKKTRKRTPRGN